MSAKNNSTQSAEGKPEQEPAEKKNRQGPPLPLMLDFSLSVSRIAIISMGVVTALLSMSAGAPGMDGRRPECDFHARYRIDFLAGELGAFSRRPGRCAPGITNRVSQGNPHFSQCWQPYHGKGSLTGN